MRNNKKLLLILTIGLLVGKSQVIATNPDDDDLFTSSVPTKQKLSAESAESPLTPKITEKEIKDFLDTPNTVSKSLISNKGKDFLNSVKLFESEFIVPQSYPKNPDEGLSKEESPRTPSLIGHDSVEFIKPQSKNKFDTEKFAKELDSLGKKAGGSIPKTVHLILHEVNKTADKEQATKVAAAFLSNNYPNQKIKETLSDHPKGPDLLKEIFSLQTPTIEIPTEKEFPTIKKEITQPKIEEKKSESDDEEDVNNSEVASTKSEYRRQKSNKITLDHKNSLTGDKKPDSPLSDKEEGNVPKPKTKIDEAETSSTKPNDESSDDEKDPRNSTVVGEESEDEDTGKAVIQNNK